MICRSDLDPPGSVMEAYPMEKEMDPPPMKQILKSMMLLWLQIPIQLFFNAKKVPKCQKPQPPKSHSYSTRDWYPHCRVQNIITTYQFISHLHTTCMILDQDPSSTDNFLEVWRLNFSGIWHLKIDVLQNSTYSWIDPDLSFMKRRNGNAWKLDPQKLVCLGKHGMCVCIINNTLSWKKIIIMV